MFSFSFLLPDFNSIAFGLEPIDKHLLITGIFKDISLYFTTLA
jgi:hypothetical protein